MEEKPTFKSGGFVTIECLAPNRKLKWIEFLEDRITRAALHDLLEVYFQDGQQLPGFAISLIKGPKAKTDLKDIHDAHPGWSEFIHYKTSGGERKVRPSWGPTRLEAQSVVNEVIELTITKAGTISGAFMVGGNLGTEKAVDETDANCKTSTDAEPVLWSTALFKKSDRRVIQGDILQISYRVGVTHG